MGKQTAQAERVCCLVTDWKIKLLINRVKQIVLAASSLVIE